MAVIINAYPSNKAKSQQSNQFMAEAAKKTRPNLAIFSRNRASQVATVFTCGICIASLLTCFASELSTLLELRWK
ncbi:hypothetical protein COLO4_23253 [Corchorus olitorius]|uniref:Uncharacterized protein n=1 Tax=Corchorus olitorius TaxID=93759 RepID=A0A1R3IHP1_9ROSI|nr:hypothetical protein COLO4_23253 [Corchorus olitorius]